MLNPFSVPGQSAVNWRLQAPVPAQNSVIYGEIEVVWQENVVSVEISRHIFHKSETVFTRDDIALMETVVRKKTSLHILLKSDLRSLQTVHGLTFCNRSSSLDDVAPARNNVVPVKYVARISSNRHN
jgi:hypothetical protein